MESARQPGAGAGDSGWSDWRTPSLLLFLAVVLIAALLFTYNSLTSAAPWLNHDVAFHSYLGFEIFHGSRLYVDVVDSNPPGAQFLLGAIIWMTDLAGIPDFLLNHFFILAVGICGLVVLRSAFRGRGESLVFILVSLAYLLVLIRGNFSNNLFASAPYIPYDFGQRGQLFSLLFLPYVMLRLSGRRPGAALCAWLVALGFVSMFKPYWPPMICLVELFCWFRPQRRSLPAIACLASGMLLPVVVLLIHSRDSFVEFFTVLIPIHLFGKYAHYDTTYAVFARSPLHIQIVAGVVVLAACLAWGGFKRRIARTDVLLMALLAAGAYLAILHQHKFWSYHAMPLFGMVSLFSAFALASALGAPEPARLRKAAALAVAVLLIVLVAAGIANLYIMLDRFPPLGHELVPLIEGHHNVMFFSMSADYIYAPLAVRMRICGPWTVHWMIPAMLDIADPETRERELDAYAATVSGRIDEARPEMLVFAPYRQALPPGESLHEIFMSLGVVPRAGYGRIPDVALRARYPQLAGWIVYVREAAR